MKRSLSAPCLIDEDCWSKKAKSFQELTEPSSREYLQLALARVLELQRQIKDDSYVTDNTSDLGESDSEEDVMKEVLTKVFKDLPGSLPSVNSLINRATQPQPPQINVVRGKRIQLAGYDTCRKVAIEFMKRSVKFAQKTDDRRETFHMGTYSRTETKMADHKQNLRQSHSSMVPKNPVVSSQFLPSGTINNSGFVARGLNSKEGNILKVQGNAANRKSDCDAQKASDNADNIKRQQEQVRVVRDYNLSLRNLAESALGQDLSRDYEIRVRMLRGLDLHLAGKQRDYTARLMRQ